MNIQWYEEQSDKVDEVIRKDPIKGNDGAYTPHKSDYNLETDPFTKDKTPPKREPSTKHLKESEAKVEIEDTRVITEDQIINSILEEKDWGETLDTLVRESITYLEGNDEIILVAKYYSIKQREEGTDVSYTFIRKGKMGVDEEKEIIQSSKTKITRTEIRDKPKSGGTPELVYLTEQPRNIIEDKPDRLGPNEIQMNGYITTFIDKEI